VKVDENATRIELREEVGNGANRLQHVFIFVFAAVLYDDYAPLSLALHGYDACTAWRNETPMLLTFPTTTVRRQTSPNRA
jgi:hypothetical protein